MMQTITTRSVVAVTAVVLSLPGIHAQTAQAPNGAESRARTSNAREAADYRLMPGDKLRVEVYKDAQLSQSLQVRPDGKVTLLWPWKIIDMWRWTQRCEPADYRFEH